MTPVQDLLYKHLYKHSLLFNAFHTNWAYCTQNYKTQKTPEILSILGLFKLLLLGSNQGPSD